jgi:hypothetical protein
MRRLLEVGTLLFVLVTFLAPLAECFDHWDPPGLNDDTEFAVFGLIFILCLVLLVSRLISVLAQSIYLVFSPLRQKPERWTIFQVEECFELVPPLLSPPLRI